MTHHLSTLIEHAISETDRLVKEGNKPVSNFWNANSSAKPKRFCLFCLAGSLMSRDTKPADYSNSEQEMLHAIENFRLGNLGRAALAWKRAGFQAFRFHLTQSTINWKGQAEWNLARPLLLERLTLLKSLEDTK